MSVDFGEADDFSFVDYCCIKMMMMTMIDKMGVSLFYKVSEFLTAFGKTFTIGAVVEQKNIERLFFEAIKFDFGEVAAAILG